MNKKLTAMEFNGVNSLTVAGTGIEPLFLARLAALGLMVLMTLTGCQTQAPQLGEAGRQAPDELGLREGDTLKISFPGAPTLNTTQQIRVDGSISLPMGGQMKVAGMTTKKLENELLRRYASELVTKEVTVALEAASFPVYVTGSVLHPGKILSNRPISAIEAIMEAGGVDYTKADLKNVAVTRYQGDRVEHYTLNLKRVLQGEQSKPFYLKPSDIVFVPEKFSWF